MTAAALQAHLATAATHVCYCWALVRRDGVAFGFTDHDQSIRFDDMDFVPDTGLSARALASSTGLSVNNTEAIGVLSSGAITEADIFAGRFDGAAVTIWLVQWDDPDARQVRFSGTLGEITRASGGFQAELRGLTDALNQPQGRSYFKTCSAVLGDGRCGVELTDPAFSAVVTLDVATDGQVFEISNLPGFNSQWFEGGLLEVQSGQAVGLNAVIRTDDAINDARTIRLWQPIPAPIEVGDSIKLIAGCDKRVATCREKFSNLINFQGFPDIPGDDWLVSVPRSDGSNDGGSLNQ